MSINDVTFFETAKHAVIPRLLAALGQLVAHYLAYRQQRADIATLHSMSNRELKDIGIYRCDVDRIADFGRDQSIDAALRARPASTIL